MIILYIALNVILFIFIARAMTDIIIEGQNRLEKKIDELKELYEQTNPRQ